MFFLACHTQGLRFTLSWRRQDVFALRGDWLCVDCARLRCVLDHAQCSIMPLSAVTIWLVDP